MKFLKCFTVVFSVLAICLFSSIGASSATSTNDNAIITAERDDLTPLYTKAPDNILNTSADFEPSDKSSQLFYTQTTFWALMAGYLILYKVKGVDHSHKNKKS